MVSTTIRPLSEELQKIANADLNEIESRVLQDINTLREWILKQPHLKARTDDQFLLSFLRGSKHSLEKAKSKIDHFYTIKTMMPEVFKNISVGKKCCDYILSGTSLWPQRPEHILGPELAITRYDNFDQKQFKLLDIMRYSALALEFILNNVDSSVICGYIEIHDLAKIPLGLYAQTDIVMIKKLAVFFEKAVPLRLKGMHIINCPKEFLHMLLLIKTFMPEKYRKQFHIHKNLKELYEYVPQDFLPKEYGGTLGTVAEIATKNLELVKKFGPYFEENDQYCVDERLRLNKKVDEQSMFGLEGSFRKLDID